MVGALVVSGVVAVFLDWTSPAEPVAERVMQWTPVGLATFLLLHLQAASLVAALLGASAVLMLVGGIGALALALTSRRVLAAGVGAVAVMLVLSFIFTPFDWRAPVVLTLVYGLLLLILPRVDVVFSSRPESSTGPAPSHNHAQRMSRRQAMVDTGAVLGGLSILTLASTSVPILFPPPDKTLFPYRFPPGARDSIVPGLTPLVTPVSDFYVNSKNLFSPRPLGWTLAIGGAVQKPHRYTLSDLQNMPLVNEYVTMECVDNPVGGPLVGTALWTGVRLRDLLHRSIVIPSSTAIVMHSADGYSESVPLSQALRDDVIVAFGMNGRTLTADHGYPARVLIPGLYGFKSVKWVTEISVGSSVEQGLWQSKGWTQTATTHTTSRIDVARQASRTLEVAGMAFAGARGITRVEVRADDRPWIEAVLLGPPLSGDAWRLWRARVPVSSASLVDARATDGTGRIQTGVSRGSYPDGATGYARRYGPFA